MEIAVTVTLPGIPEALNNLADAIRGNKKKERPLTAGKPAPVIELPKPEPKEEKPVEESPLNMEAIEAVTPEPVEAPVEEKKPEPEPAKEYTFADISNAGAALCSQGLAKINELTALLNTKYGVAAITKLKPEQYTEIAEDLRKLGATL